MISHKHKCIFVHIPKTAGTSIESALRQSNAEFEPLQLGDFDPATIPPHANGYRGLNRWDIKHYPAQFLRQDYNEYLKFCFVRNPWDLMVSCYFWWLQRPQLEIRKIQGRILKQMGFANFVFSFYTDYINEIFHQGLGQSYWLLDELGSPVVNFVGRFETLQHDFDIVCDQIEIAKIQLPSTNRSIRSRYFEYYNEDTQKLIGLKFSSDIDRFNYSFHDKS